MFINLININLFINVQFFICKKKKIHPHQIIDHQAIFYNNLLIKFKNYLLL